MRIKIIILTAAVMIAAGITFDANAQTRRTTRRPVARKVVKKPVAPLVSGAVKTQSGLIFLTTRPGTGVQAKAGNTVSVHYTGTLTDGTKFDSSRDRGEPIEFPLGQGRVIKGWDEGIARMRVGEQAILVIPPAIGYGSRGAGGGMIPPDATLIFVVELVGVK